MEDFIIDMAFIVIVGLLASLVYGKLSSVKLYCPVCGIKAKKLFGDCFRVEAIKAVLPKEAQADAQDILYCDAYNDEGVYHNTDSAAFLSYCPRCREWNLKFYCANKGWRFTCQTPNCGFNFSVIN